MLYSSGTTGRPKGVLQPFKTQPIDTLHPLMKVLCVNKMGMDASSTYLSPAPLYHAAPLRFTMTAAALGATTVVMEKFDAETFLALIERHRVTHSQLVPTMFVRMLKLPDVVRDKYDISSLRAAVHAAAPLPARHQGSHDRLVGPHPDRILRRHRRQRRHPSSTPPNGSPTAAASAARWPASSKSSTTKPATSCLPAKSAASSSPTPRLRLP